MKPIFLFVVVMVNILFRNMYTSLIFIASIENSHDYCRPLWAPLQPVPTMHFLFPPYGQLCLHTTVGLVFSILRQSFKSQISNSSSITV